MKDLRTELEQYFRDHRVFGNVLLGKEGINGTVCYPSSSSIETKLRENEESTPSHVSVCEHIREKFPGIRLRTSYDEKNVFHRLKIRIKKEIVTLGVSEVDPCQRVGTYVPPGSQWHDLLEDPNTLVIDTRNDYEVQLGTFKNAVNPATTSFVEFPAWFEQQIKQKRPQRLAMFCTGGIRCEKASSYCLSHRVVMESGIPVYHLEGGILAYLDQIPVSESLWQGECFVFDTRTAVGHGLKPSTQFSTCHACRHPLGPDDRQSPDFQIGVACPYCAHQQDRVERRQRYQDRQKQCQLSEGRAVPHIHDGKLAMNLHKQHTGNEMTT